MPLKKKVKRSTLPPGEARAHFVNAAELAVLEQVQEHARLLDKRQLAVGPFSHLDAGMVAGKEGKTRGAITNLFKSQAAFQAATMEHVLNTGHWIDHAYPIVPEEFRTADQWMDAFLLHLSEFGPNHGGRPEVNYGFLWALWLSTVPYAIWNKRLSVLANDEQTHWLSSLEALFERVIRHFGLKLRDGVSLNDLAMSVETLMEGVWLSQCLRNTHPGDPGKPISEALRRGGLMLWRGAIEPDTTRNSQRKKARHKKDLRFA